ncbi:Delta-aminolevulinic acid dehydratase (plasmid) [Vibrio sp. THAF191c]|nr:Delta-aminolevulinic acid dehydratase [Vibrio sp. THAF64]QGM37610.1 Delta-aminolevulinic acid dehydratase [Vibrio sp. THAF191d]QGN73333.1 Delta-aminolevulinic acid dehydratase [Vibrio sp. THAF191c]
MESSSIPSPQLGITQRLRRLRTTPIMRTMVREHDVQLHDLIYPLFVEEALASPVPIAGLPGLTRIPESQLTDEIRALDALGIRAVMPFGVSHHKDDIGSDTWHQDGLLSRMIRTIKSTCPHMLVIPDICFCEYTTHGHCGALSKHDVDNDQTVANLVKQCINAAEAGADMLAPSSMMDGQVGAIRRGLDAAGFTKVAILAHSAKFASAFYGPFRQAVECELEGDRRTYQLDYANGRQALSEALLDEQEGADILMVKPGTPYLDVLTQLRTQTRLPLAAYQVSGEYAAIKCSAEMGIVNEQEAVLETLTGFKRAGADLIVTYFAKQFAIWQQADTMPIVE